MSKSRLKQHKLFFDIEKENEYVSEMNRLGWKLERINFGWTYEFSRTNREEYTTVIFAEESSKVSETTAFAKRCGFELIPHRFDGLKDVLYLCGRRDEVSPVFHNDSKSLMRAYRLTHRRFSVLSVICVLILAVMFCELTAFFIIPSVSLGKNPSEFPLFFGLTVLFSVLTLIFAVLTVIFIRSALGAKKKIETLKKKEDEKQKRRRAKKDNPKQEDKVIHRRMAAVDLTKLSEPDQNAEEKAE